MSIENQIYTIENCPVMLSKNLSDRISNERNQQRMELVDMQQKLAPRLMEIYEKDGQKSNVTNKRSPVTVWSNK